MEIENQEHLDLLDVVAKNNDFQDYTLDIKHDSKKGDGYMSKIIKISLKDHRKILPVVLKLAPTKKEFREVMHVRNLFLKEIWMYEKVFIAFNEFQLSNNFAEGFKGYAKCFITCDKDYKEALVLENLTDYGYHTWNRKIPMDHHHIALVMSQYGKFHAVSMAIRHKEPQLFQEFEEFLQSWEDPEQQKSGDFSIIDTASKHIRRAIKGNVEMEKAFEIVLKDTRTLSSEMIEENKEYSVIRHVDCWCNNMMFKYKVNIQ